MMLFSSMYITYECRKLDRNVWLLNQKSGSSTFLFFFNVLNREKTGSLAHLDVMENTGRMYVHVFCFYFL